RRHGSSRRASSSPRSPLRTFVLVRVPLACWPLLRWFVRFACFAHDAAALGHLRRVVGDAYFVVKELAAHVAGQLHELAGVFEQPSVAIELLNPHGERAKQCLEIARASLVIGLLLLRHAPAASEGPVRPE